MRLLFALTYYRPHISGLTIHVQRVAEGLAARGHEVTVLTSRYDASLPLLETREGVRIRRVRVLWRVGKGVLSPGLASALAEEIPKHDVVTLSMPATPDAVFLGTTLARRHGRPILVIWACDMQFGSGMAERWLERLCIRSFGRACEAAARILTLSDDYARFSPMLAPRLDKVTALPPPIRIAAPTPEAIRRLRERFGISRAFRHVAFAARLATEKGVEYLLPALGRLRDGGLRVRLVLTGDQSKVIGERAYQSRIGPLLDAQREDVITTGELADDEMAACFAACDVTVLPSVNTTESFGMVQVESMLSGTPVVASDLPGVRDPVRRTGMGLLVPPRDPTALAGAIEEVLTHRDRYVRSRVEIEEIYGYETSLAAHDALLWEMARKADLPERREVREELTRQLGEVPAFRALQRTAEWRLVRAAGPFRRPLLDLGCGDGHFAEALSFGFEAGVDPDSRALTEARKRRAHGILIEASATSMPFPNGSFGTVVCNSTLEHLPDLESALREVRRVLSPGGRLVVTVPSHLFAETLAVPSFCRALGLDGLGRSYERWFNRRAKHRTTEDPVAWTRRLLSHGLRVVAGRTFLSAGANRAFDLLHYAALPNLIAHRLTGRWTPGLLRPLNIASRRWLEPLLEESPDAAGGAQLFIVAERTQ